MPSWFKPTTSISVSSVLYSLTGSDSDQKNIKYIKSSIYSAIVNRKPFIGESLVNDHLVGPGIQQRQFFNWCKYNNFPGLPDLSIQNSYNVDSSIVKQQIALIENISVSTITMSSSIITDADYSYFSTRHIMDDFPLLLNTNWISEYNSSNQTITIQFESGSVEIISVPDFDVNAQYIISEYEESSVNRLFIYKIGGSNAILNNLKNSDQIVNTKEFYPFIPIRLDNVSITNSTYVNNNLYNESTKAYERIFRTSKFIDIIDSIEDNSSISQIDYAYISFGVPLNSTDNSNKKYIYNFFKSLINYQSNNQNLSNTIKISTSDHVDLRDFDMRIYWTDISETVEQGLSKPNVKNNEVWLEKVSNQTINIYHQVNENSYNKLSVINLVHRNFIYGGKYVHINGHQALDDTDISGFLLPLHNPTLKNMSLVDSTQVAISNSFVIFNSYTIFKQKWYQTTVFKIIIVVAAIVLSVVTAGGSLAASAGVLGTNIAVGTALGLTGTTAIIAGAVANALAAIVITNLITAGATELFGDKIGAIVGAILSFVVITAGSGGFSNIDPTSFANPEAVMKLANVLSNSYAGWTEANIIDINDQIKNKQTEYEDSLKNINDMLSKFNSTNNLYFNPLELTDVNNKGNEGNGDVGSYLPETLDQFIQRTTMVGSDVAEITLAMVNDYSELSLQLPKN